MAKEAASPAKPKKGIGRESMVDVAKLDALKAKGFRIESDDKGHWAIETKGKKRRFGPASSYAALVTMVTIATGKDLPEDPYDLLSPEAKDLFDAIGSLGWRPIDASPKGWTAEKINGKGKVGPCESLQALLSEVKVVAAGETPAEVAKEQKVHRVPKGKEKGVTLVDEDKKGRLLPGHEVASVPHLDDLIKRRAEAVKVFTSASAKVQEINEECRDAFAEFKEHFVLHGDEQKHIYRSPTGVGELRIKHAVTDKVETELFD